MLLGLLAQATGWIVTPFAKMRKTGDGSTILRGKKNQEICFNHVKSEISVI